MTSPCENQTFRFFGRRFVGGASRRPPNPVAKTGKFDSRTNLPPGSNLFPRKPLKKVFEFGLRPASARKFFLEEFASQN